MSAKAVNVAQSLCIEFEGISLTPYLCPAGVPTIGMGSTRHLNGNAVSLKDAPITEEYAYQLLTRDLNGCYMSALKLSPNLAADDNRLAAIIDFIYNLGSSRYSASTLRRRVNTGDYQEAKEEIMKWVWGGGRKLPGLIRRRAAEGELL